MKSQCILVLFLVGFCLGNCIAGQPGDTEDITLFHTRRTYNKQTDAVMTGTVVRANKEDGDTNYILTVTATDEVAGSSTQSRVGVTFFNYSLSTATLAAGFVGIHGSDTDGHTSQTTLVKLVDVKITGATAVLRIDPVTLRRSIRVNVSFFAAPPPGHLVVSGTSEQWKTSQKHVAVTMKTFDVTFDIRDRSASVDDTVKIKAVYHVDGEKPSAETEVFTAP